MVSKEVLLKEYRIKKNFAKAGNIGPYPMKNVIEAFSFSLIEIYLVCKIPAELSIKLMLLVLLLFPTLALSLIGIGGNSLTEIVYRFVKFHVFTKRSYSEPTAKEFGDREKKILVKKRRQLEAKMLNKSRNKEVNRDGADESR